MSAENAALAQEFLNTPGSPNTCVREAHKVKLLLKDIRKLLPNEWLNDEVINMWMQVLTDLPSLEHCCFMKTYIMNLLHPETGDYSYDKVKRWIQKEQLERYNDFFFPINITNSHWTLAVLKLV